MMSTGTKVFGAVAESATSLELKLIRNEVTNNSSTVCHRYATSKRLYYETTAEVRIEPQVT